MNARNCVTCVYGDRSYFENPCNMCDDDNSMYEVDPMYAPEPRPVKEVFEDILTLAERADVEYDFWHNPKNNSYMICIKEKNHD